MDNESTGKLLNNDTSRGNNNLDGLNQIKENSNIFLKNTLNLFKDIKNENVFYNIIENINTYINKLKKENEFHDFLFSYNGLIEEYYTVYEEYIVFTKIIENLNSLDIIEILIILNFNKRIFDILLFSYNDLYLIEVKRIYHILFELTYVLIENLTIYEEKNSFSSELIDKMFLRNDLKYINKKQINNIYIYINEKNCDYMNMVFSLLEFILDLNDKIYNYFLNSNIDCTNYINELIIIKKDIYEKLDDNNNEKHYLPDLYNEEDFNSIEKNNLLINNMYFKKRKNEDYDDYIKNYIYTEKKYNENKSTEKEKKLLDCIYICNYENNIVLIKNNNGNNGNVEEKKEKNKFASEMKLTNINLNLLKISICTLFKAKKITQYMNENFFKRFFYVFNDMLNDIIKSLHKKNYILFLDYFFSDILKSVILLVFYYNENIEDTPKQTMLFYKSLNKVIDHISIYLHNKKIFYEIYYDKNITKNFFNVKKFLYNFDKTYYMLFYIFYTIIEKTNHLNNEIFLFFCSEIINKKEKNEDKKVKICGLEEKEKIVKLKLERLHLNKNFLINYKKEVQEKSINRIITIFIFLEKKIKKYICFFRYILCFIWNKFKKKKKKKKKDTLSDFDIIIKKIEYVLLDMFIKFTDTLIIYKYCFSEKNDTTKVCFFDEFHLYMKSIQQIIFTSFIFIPNNIINKIDKYTKDKSNLVKYNIEENEFIEFNKKLYFFSELNDEKKNNIRNKEKNIVNISDTFDNQWKNVGEGIEDEYNIYKGDGISSHENGKINTKKENICNFDSVREKILKYDIHNNTKMEKINNFTEYDIIVLNILSVIFMNIMKEVINNKYKFVYFKNSIIHIELLKKLLYILINNKNTTDNIYDFEEKKIYINKEKGDLDSYFCFPYEFLSSIIISQLNCFMNDNLCNYKIYIVFLEFLFYISSSINPFFFYISKKIWEYLGYFINKSNDVISLSVLLQILFYLISDKDKTYVVKNNEIIFHKIKKTNSKQYLLFLFLKNQVVLNRNGKNYLFFFHIFLKNVNSEKLIATVMKSFFYKFHMNLQYSLNILLKYLNAYEQKVEKREKEEKEREEKELSNEKKEKKNVHENLEINNTEYKNSPNRNVSLSKNLFQKSEQNEEIIDECKIISIFIYFDIIKILPEKFLHFASEINLMKEFQNFFYFLIYLYDEFKLLEKRNEKYIHTKIFNRIKITKGQYYYNCAKIYFPIITSSLISHFLFSLLNENSFLSNFRIIKFYESFFSNKYLYTLCNNYIYIKILNEAFIILLHLKKTENYLNNFENLNDKKNEIKESLEEFCENLIGYEKNKNDLKEAYNSNNKIDKDLNIFSCLFKVYIIFLKEYSYFFFSSMIILIKKNIILNEFNFIDFYKNVYNNLKNEEKYSPSFKHLMLSIFEYFFNKNNKILDNENIENILIDKKENIKLLHNRKNFLNIFFQNCCSSKLLSNFYLKSKLSKFLQRNLRTISSDNDVENLSNMLLVNLHNWTNI
ncbi:conserved Plasmodium protein, unknown function [Plasmodium relictum]|uniref:Uncharacterized protein n=1 Tax=Plasmodium relictum TaxID=85471 RepID=A0A1J1H7K8_PLARL|nr:conserved Plasmodium protein, unknown function [Plasmodium relictum]CRG99414.1 conserved Plasmodium protein, unknown function [Plasmodium relictum]